MIPRENERHTKKLRKIIFGVKESERDKKEEDKDKDTQQKETENAGPS